MSKTIPRMYKGRGDQKGYVFTLEYREVGIAIYSKYDGKTPPTYEVMLILAHKADRVMDGRVICKEGDEYLPASSQWGSKGWSYYKKSDAMSKLNKLKERIKT